MSISHHIGGHHVILCLFLGGSGEAKKLLVLSLRPIGELIVADLVVGVSVPRLLLNELVGSLPIVHTQSELVPINVRLAEVRAVLDELLYVTALSLFVNEGFGLFCEGLDLLSCRL